MSFVRRDIIKAYMFNLDYLISIIEGKINKYLNTNILSKIYINYMMMISIANNK